jgi:hypothetical protein
MVSLRTLPDPNKRIFPSRHDQEGQKGSVAPVVAITGSPRRCQTEGRGAGGELGSSPQIELLEHTL